MGDEEAEQSRISFRSRYESEPGHSVIWSGIHPSRIRSSSSTEPRVSYLTLIHLDFKNVWREETSSLQHSLGLSRATMR